MLGWSGGEGEGTGDDEEAAAVHQQVVRWPAAKGESRGGLRDEGRR